MANWPELQGHMAEQYFKVSTGNSELLAEELHYPASNEVKIIPVIGGSGGNTTRFIIGAALIAVAIAAPGAGLFLKGSMGFGAFGGSALYAAAGNLGLALVIGGIADMLSPTPKNPEYEQDPKLSYSFGGVQNTTRAGTPVPIVYGEIFTGSVIISAAIDTEQVVA